MPGLTQSSKGAKDNSWFKFFKTGLSKTALRNLWSGALCSENFQFCNIVHSSPRSINLQDLTVAFSL
jgi:hypothetical protein